LEEQILEMSPELDFLSPENGTVVSSENINILIKAFLGTELTLRVNDQIIGSERIGKKVDNREGGVTIYEFIAVKLLLGQKNYLRAEIKDQFGSSRGIKEISIETIGKPAKIILHADKDKLPADGTSIMDIAVTILDQEGRIVPDPGIITGYTTAGMLVNKDLDTVRDGTQISCREGMALFKLKSPRQTQDAEISVSYNGMVETMSVFFAPHLRNMFLTGFGELTIGHGKTKGNFDSLLKENQPDDGYYSDGKGAFFLKGNIGRDILITAAYDSDKKKEDELFGREKPDLDAEKNYTHYGDTSKLGFEAQSSDKLYLKMERNKSFLLYGDYHTDLKHTKLSAYSRSFNGFKSDINVNAFTLKTFASYTDQTQVVDKLQARGISGYYYLTTTPIIEGTEMVVIETRERLRPDRVLKRERLVRETDYDIDYELGTILFESPISSFDIDDNLNYIIVSYESEGSGQRRYIYGGRSGVKLTRWLELGFSGITEEKQVENYHLYGGDLTLKLPGKTTIKSEWVHTDSLFTLENIYTAREDTGWMVEMESKPLTKLTLTGYYRRIGNYFGNSSAVDTIRGSEKYGSEIKYQFDPDTEIRGKYYDENDDLNDMEHDFASLGIEKNFGSTGLELEVSHETSNDEYIPAGGYTSREPFDISEDTTTEATSAKIKVDTELGPNFSLYGEHKQDLQNNQHNLSQAGLEYKIRQSSRIYVRHEYGKYEERAENRTSLGVEAQVTKNTVAFNEYKISDGIDGSRNLSSMGLRNKFKLNKKLSGSISLEKLVTVHGEERQGNPDSFAVASKLEYRPEKNMKYNTRLEYRHEHEKSSHLVELGMTCPLHPDYSLSFRERLFYDVFQEQGNRKKSQTLLGLAYRPIFHDRFNALAKVEFNFDENTSTVPKEIGQKFLSSFEGIYQLNKRAQLIGKYAAKLVREDDFNAYTDLVSGRIIYDLTSRFDLGVEYRILHSHKVESLYQGGSVEVGCRLVKNLWFSLGYSFDDFDTDLTGESYRGEGPYVKLRFKFDEKTFKRK